jgi:hypothetical protein
MAAAQLTSGTRVNARISGVSPNQRAFTQYRQYEIDRNKKAALLKTPIYARRFLKQAD